MTKRRGTGWLCGGALLLLIAAQPAAQDPPRQNPPVQDPVKPVTPPQDVPPPIPFDEWVMAFKAEARTKGISDATLDAAFTGLVPDPVVITRDRAQPDQVQTLDDYLTAHVTTKVLTRASEVAVESKTLLAKVEKVYGVPAPIMIAIWAAESNFGQITGKYSTITSLATLAYDGRRPVLFRGELIEALRIVDRGLVPLADLKGSWAGAIGQAQFLPSSFLKHGVDFDKDGRVNLWTSEADVLGSMAEYLSAAGWVKGQRWGREVLVSDDVLPAIDQDVPLRTTGCGAFKNMTTAAPLAHWKKLGVTLPDGNQLPTASIDASLVRGVHRHFLVYHNYDALLAYNCSNAYAISLGLIADSVTSKKN